jgi:hypothetical protein
VPPPSPNGASSVPHNRSTSSSNVGAFSYSDNALKSYGAVRKDMGLGIEHRQHKGLNNRAENPHLPTRRRERMMKRFKSPRHVPRLLSIHDQVADLFHFPRNDFPATISQPSIIESPAPRHFRPGPAIAAASLAK